MTKPSKRPRDANQLAKFIADLAVGSKSEPPKSQVSDFAREGGRKGGKARAEKLTAAERSRIASNAANTRWGKKSD